MLLVVPEDLEHNGLALDVFDEGLGHLYCNILNMVEAKRGSPASVLQGFSGEGLIMAVDKVELAEDVSIFGRDTGRLQDCDPEGEGTAQTEVVQGCV